MRLLLNWLDDRTGYRKLVHEALYESIPGGSRWRYVWGSTLVFAFVVQMITGAFLWMAYSPGGQTAWESVYYIQHEMQGGWLLRGLHHFMAQAMVVLLVLHLMQVVIDGAYRAPREVNFWLGLILMQIVLGLSLTGYLLPWDQKGFWATGVATNLMGLVPYVGGDLQRLVVGGANYGHHTLTRFFALHAGILPAMLVGFLVLHLALFRRHGLCARDPERRPASTFWPDQILKDSVACLAVLAVVLFFVVRPGLPNYLGGESAGWNGDHLGAELGAPADPAEPYASARPEWYFLFLFQFLKFFEGEQEIYGAIVIPGLMMLALFLMPLIGRWKLGHGFNVGLLLCLIIGVGFLTAQAFYDDHLAEWHVNAESYAQGDEERLKRYENSQSFIAAVEEADRNAVRVKTLIARPGADQQKSLIPVAGAVSLLREDPFTQGPQMFARYCASCHSHAADEGRGIIAAEPSAPNLFGVGSRQWLSGLLDPEKVAGPQYFGNTSHQEGEMAGFVQSELAELDDDGKQKLHKVIAAVSAEARLPAQRQQDLADSPLIAEGRTLLIEDAFGCLGCHRFHENGEEGLAPILTGWHSRDWLMGIISNPAHPAYYSERNDRMPAFNADPEKPEAGILSAQQIGLLADWLRHDWYEESADNSAPEARSAGGE